MKKRLFYFVGLPLGLLVLVIVLLNVALIYMTGRLVEQEHAKIRAAGDPLFLIDYAQTPIPNDKNGLHFIKLAAIEIQAFQTNFLKATEQISFARALRKDEVQGLEKLVEQHETMYRLLDYAASCDEFDWQLDLKNPLSLIESDLVTQSRAITQALTTKALVLAYRGEGDAALRECQKALKLSQAFRRPPTLLSLLIEMSNVGLILEAAHHVISTAETSPEARAAFAADLAKLNFRRQSLEALKGERAWGVSSFQQIRAGSGSTAELAYLESDNALLKQLTSTWLGRAYLNDDEAKYLEEVAKLLPLSQLPRAQRAQPIEAILKELEEASWRYAFTQSCLSSFAPSFDAVDGNDAQVRAMLVYLALVGKEDAKLEDLGLAKELTTDPFNELPLVMKKVDGNWVVYSVGKNGTDDGGLIDDDTDDWFKHSDIGFGPLKPAAELSEHADDEDSENE